MAEPKWRRYLRFWKSDPRADAEDELSFHIESRIAEFRAGGMSEDDARAEAMRRFGDLSRARDRLREIVELQEQDRRRTDMWDALRQDLRYAGRALRRNPGFTLVAVLTLALGIGANTAIFSVINGVLLRPLPYPDPGRLVRVFTSFRGSGTERYAVSQPEFMDYKGLKQVFENAAAFSGASVTMTGDGEPERLRGIAATHDLLPVLGIQPLYGRNFESRGRPGRRRIRGHCHSRPVAEPIRWGSIAPGPSAADEREKPARRRDSASGRHDVRGPGIHSALHQSGQSRRTGIQLSQRHRAASAGHDGRPRQDGARGTHQAKGRGVQANVPDVDGVQRDGGVDARRNGRRHPAAVDDPAGRRRPGTPDRVRQRGEPAAGARRSEATGSRGPVGVRRQRTPDPPATADRKHGAGADRGRGRNVARLVGDEGPAQREPGSDPAIPGDSTRPDRRHRHTRAGHADRDPVRVHTGPAPRPHGAAIDPEGRRSRRHGGPSPATWSHAGDGRGRAIGRCRDRRRAAVAKLPGTQGHRSGVPSRKRAGGGPLTSAGAV